MTHLTLRQIIGWGWIFISLIVVVILMGANPDSEGVIGIFGFLVILLPGVLILR